MTIKGENHKLCIVVGYLTSGNLMESKELIYQIKLEGHIHLDLSASFEKIRVEHTPEGQTILIGALPDQTALHGVLMRIRDLGLFLVEVKRIDRPTPSD